MIMMMAMMMMAVMSWETSTIKVLQLCVVRFMPFFLPTGFCMWRVLAPISFSPRTFYSCNSYQENIINVKTAVEREQTTEVD